MAGRCKLAGLSFVYLPEENRVKDSLHYYFLHYYFPPFFIARLPTENRARLPADRSAVPPISMLLPEFQESKSWVRDGRVHPLSSGLVPARWTIG